MQEETINNDSPAIGNVLLADIALEDCIIRPRIIVGEIVPHVILFSFLGGSGFTDMGSFIIDNLFRKHLKTLQNEEYEFSGICRNENEKKAFELAIEENCQSIGLKVVGYID